MLKAVKKVASAMRRHVGKRFIPPITSYALIRDGHVFVTDVNHWISIRATDSSGIDLPDAMIPLAELASWIEDRYSPGEATVEQWEEFPSPEKHSFPVDCEILENIPVHHLKAVLPFISKDQSRTSLNSMLIEATEREDINMVATDSYRLISIPVHTEIETANKWLIPRDLVEIVTKIFSDQHATVTLFLTPERVWFDGCVDGVNVAVSGSIPGSSVSFPNWQWLFNDAERDHYTVSYQEFQELKKRSKTAATNAEIALNGRMGFFTRDRERQLVGLTTESDNMKYCEPSIGVNLNYLCDMETLAVSSGVKKRDLGMTEFNFEIEHPEKPMVVTHSASVARSLLMPRKMR